MSTDAPPSLLPSTSSATIAAGRALHVSDAASVEQMLRVQAHKLASESLDWHWRGAYLLHALADDTVHYTATFVKYTRDELVEAMQTDKRSVHWLLEQVTTYEPSREFVAGVVFGSGEVLAHVFPRKVKKPSVSASSRNLVR